MTPFLVLLCGYVLAAPLTAALGRRAPRLAVALATAPHVVALVVLARQAPAVLDGGALRAGVDWAAQLDLRVSFALDGLSLLMAVLVAATGILVGLYAAGYSGRGGALGPMLGGLVAFAGAMQVVVLADDLLTLFVGWELTSVASFGLIGQSHHRRAARDAARQALLVTGVGGLALLAGLVLLGQATGEWTLSGLTRAGVPGGTAVEVAVLLVVIGAATKSAQVPFSTWLPGAMAAPTPVSAYLHSATMVKAGVYLLLRMAPVLEPTDTWTPLVVSVGCTTLLAAGWRALQADDAKQLLAWSTVSQLGLLVTAIGVGGEVLLGVLALVVAHALAKAALFMVVGAVDVGSGTRDLREIGGVWRRHPILGVAVVTAGASLAGIPPLAGFVAKEAVLEGLLHADALGVAMAIAVATGSALTVAYTTRLIRAGFGPVTVPADRLADERVRAALLGWPAAALGVAGLLLGWSSGVQDALVGSALARISAVAETPHLSLWHGLTPALGLSALAVAGGIGLIALLGTRHAPRLWPAPPEGTFTAGLDVLGNAARRLSAVVQSGSLPVYLATLLGVLIVVPGIPLVAAAVEQGRVPSDGLRAGEALLGLAIATAAIVTARTERRFAAVMSLGAVGFGVALIFVGYGAPDLALTQLVVETLTLMLFVLALRELPQRFGPQPAVLSGGVRWMLALGVGSLVTTFTLVAGAARTAPSPSADLIALAEPQGGGKNVVNVILTDIRALDTVGEITVLLVAAIGIALLVNAGRPHGPALPALRDPDDALAHTPPEDVPPDLQPARVPTGSEGGGRS
jgi:multicomponent Na+:H+ antiporter subunit A